MRLYSQDTVVFVLTILAIAGQTLLLVGLSWYVAELSLMGLMTFPIIWTDPPLLITLMFVFPVYCLVVASLFPKRRLSPILIHLGTFGFFALMTSVTMMQMIGSVYAPPFPPPTHIPTKLTAGLMPFFDDLLNQSKLYAAAAGTLASPVKIAIERP